MKTFKQFISEKGFVRRVGEPIGVRDYVNAVDIINKTETNPLKKKLRMDRLDKNIKRREKRAFDVSFPMNGKNGEK